VFDKSLAGVRHSSPLRRLGGLALPVALVLGFAAPANATVVNWSCYYYSAQACFSGAPYDDNDVVVNDLYVNRYEVCAKGRTEAGNTRAGGGNGCAYNTHYRISCMRPDTPLTTGYVYWAGSGQPTTNRGYTNDDENYYISFCSN